METLDNNISNNSEQGFNGQIRDYILEIARWARFIGIVGFIGIGLMVILGFYLGAAMNAVSRPEFGEVSPMGGMGGGLFTFIYILMAALYFFPVYYLYKGAIGLRDGIRNGDISTLEDGFKNLKSHYKFIGILLIIVLSIYALIFVGALLVAAIV
jgi:hypothetical protein